MKVFLEEQEQELKRKLPFGTRSCDSVKPMPKMMFITMVANEW